MALERFLYRTDSALAGMYGVVSRIIWSFWNCFFFQFISSVNDLYNGRLLAEINLAESSSHSFQQVRQRRSVSAFSDPSVINETVITNLAEPNNPELAIVINIVVWVVVGIALAVLATSYFIWFMDPGRDSIIYRMTTQRMKADWHRSLYLLFITLPNRRARCLNQSVRDAPTPGYSIFRFKSTWYELSMVIQRSSFPHSH